MAFSDHKIAAFTHKITDLPDQPNLPADELKARFDSSPEELRQAHNALCDDADRLDNRVSGIIAETFGDAIPKSMLSDELQDELDGFADSIETLDAQKCEVYFGTYTGNGQSDRTISVGFQPKAVLVIDPVTDTSTTERLNFCGLGLQGNPVSSHVQINANGFFISRFTSANQCLNVYDRDYIFIAFH